LKSKILIIENSVTCTNLLKNILEHQGAVAYTSQTGANIQDVVIDNDIDIVLLSMVLPGADGFEIIRSLQEMERTKDIPVIMLSSFTSVDKVKEALESGAYDYIKKPPDPVELVARIHAALRFKTKMDMLKDYAERDALTNLYNKFYFSKVIDEYIAKTRAFTNGLALVMLDCDFFKKINDLYGHMAGDVVLSGVANAMVKSVKSTDVVCRFGGEEFCIILPDTTKSQAFRVTERIRRNISKIVFRFCDETVGITISGGISHTDLYNIKTAPQLIQEADTALYDAKRNGRNRTEVCWKDEI